jgi:glycosyltransferase involved in cell wall biosynthesis
MDKIPANIVLTGYLSDSDYKKMLSSCDIVIDLTNRENCLVCGSYEAVAMEKPLIVSDTVALKEYFYQGTVYTDNSASNIADSIRTAYQNLDRLRIEVRQLKSEIKIAWPEYLQQLESRLKQCISNNAG